MIHVDQQTPFVHNIIPKFGSYVMKFCRFISIFGFVLFVAVFVGCSNPQTGIGLKIESGINLVIPNDEIP